ncbi:MAG: hypothetical protein IPM25_20110, partial [Chloracidobacterium sp.]|nr:hypothetical protein [Chloracidobacterium sp.]
MLISPTHQQQEQLGDEGIERRDALPIKSGEPSRSNLMRVFKMGDTIDWSRSRFHMMRPIISALSRTKSRDTYCDLTDFGHITPLMKRNSTGAMECVIESKSQPR